MDRMGPPTSRAAVNVAISIFLLLLGVAGGAMFGIMSQQGPAPADAVEEATNYIAAVGTVDQFTVGVATEPEAAEAAPAVRRVRRVVKRVAAPAASPAGTAPEPIALTVPPATAGAVGGSGDPNCDRLEDKMIYWLLDLVEDTRQSHPDQAAVAARVDQQLRGALGKNMCAEEAQVYVGSMCADPAIKDFMHLMVDELAFYIRPLVGDPCTKDLVAAAAKWL